METAKNNIDSFDRAQVREILNYSEQDRHIWDEELENFMPRKIFDAHTHLWNKTFSKDANPPNDWGNYDTGLKELQDISSLLYPGRELHFLSFPSPVRNTDHKGVSEWAALELEQDRQSYCAMLLSPEISAADIESFISKHANCVALKPYFSMVDKKMPSIAEYLPEAQMEVADARKITVIMHLPKAPEYYLKELQYYNSKYPRINWQLAHCANSFLPEEIGKVIKQLADLPNICYDTAVRCNRETLKILFRHENRKRILFGSDNALVIGGCRRNGNIHGHEFKTFRLFEELLGIRDAFRSLNLSPEETEDFFFRNAENILCRKQ